MESIKPLISIRVFFVQQRLTEVDELIMSIS